MAVDKLVDSSQLNSDLTSVANAIRAKSGGSSQLAFPAGFVSAIQSIPAGGGSDVLVVTLDWDDNEEMWVPDKTYAEISAAYAAEKTITVQSAYPDQMIVADGFCDGDVILYFVFYPIEDSVIGAQVYLFSEEGLSLEETVSLILPSGTINISQSGNTDVTQYETAYVPSAFWGATISEDCRFVTENGVRKWLCIAYKAITTSGWIDASQSGDDEIVMFNAVPANTTITPSAQAQTVGGANYMMEGPVTVAAMPSGTEGTPTATKGTVSNHAVTITPSVTNSAGYIAGGTHSGTPVQVTAAELVSGSETKNANGTYDVTNLASLVVAVPFQTIYSGSGAPSAAQGVNGDVYIQTGS